MKQYKCNHTFKADNGLYFYNGEQVTQQEYVILRSHEKAYFTEIVEEEDKATIGTGIFGIDIPSYTDYSSNNSDSLSNDNSYSDSSSSDFGGGDFGGGGSSGDW